MIDFDPNGIERASNYNVKEELTKAYNLQKEQMKLWNEYTFKVVDNIEVVDIIDS